MITFRCVDPRDPTSGVLLEVTCSEEWMNWVTQKLQQIGDIARLAEMRNELMTAFLWKFSSPALTREFREYILNVSSGDQASSPSDDSEDTGTRSIGTGMRN